MTHPSMNTNDLAISIQNLSFDVRVGFLQTKKNILNDLNLNVRKGSVTAVVGPNGAGKTTLMHLVLGLKQASKGDIQILGTNSEDPNARKKIGFVPERPYLPDAETGEQVLRFFGKLSGVTSELNERIDSLLKLVHLYEAKNTKLKDYSKGMLQRLLIAQALLHDPDLFLLDEPMSGLDPDGRRQIRSLILELQRQGKTIVFTTHAIEDVEWLASDLVLISKGNVQYSGSAREYLDQHAPEYELAFKDLSYRLCKNITELQSEISRVNSGIVSIRQRRPGIEEWYQQ